MTNALQARESTYAWEEVPRGLSSNFSNGGQAAQVSILRKRRSLFDPRDPQLFVCKYYSTSGKGPNQIDGGAKYVFREFEILSSITHAKIVRYEDFSFDPGGPGLAQIYMEYCDAGDLSQFEDRSDKQLSWQEGSQVLLQMAEALLYLHHGVAYYHDVYEYGQPGEHVDDYMQRVFENGDYFNHTSLAAATQPKPSLGHGDIEQPNLWKPILHRDIKPANIFVISRRNGRIDVKLGDFGIAKFETDGTHTQVGSVPYLAPEQRASFAGIRRTTIKSDIFALGVTLANVVKDAALESKDFSVTRFHALLSRCMEENDDLRPTSAGLIEDISWKLSLIEHFVSEHLEDRQRHLTILQRIASAMRVSSGRGFRIDLFDRLLESSAKFDKAQLEIIYAASKGYSKDFEDVQSDGSPSIDQERILLAESLLRVWNKHDRSSAETAKHLKGRESLLTECLLKARRAEDTAVLERVLMRNGSVT